MGNQKNLRSSYNLMIVHLELEGKFSGKIEG